MKQTGNQNKKNFYDTAAKNGTSEVKQIEEKKKSSLSFPRTASFSSFKWQFVSGFYL